MLFRQSKLIETQIDDFLDAVSEGAIVFCRALKDYLGGNEERFCEGVETITRLENRADDLRREIERHLYTHSLIPESRGDVLGLLEHLDDVINTAKATLFSFEVERPLLLDGTRKDWAELADIARQAAEAVVLATRAFFRDPRAVGDNLHKVYFYEKEGDRAAIDLKRKIFASDIELAHKMHLRDCARKIDKVSDVAENVADRLAIYSIKRTV